MNTEATDRVLTDIAAYVSHYEIKSAAAYETARYGLMDALGCAIAALNSQECRARLGPLVPGASLQGGARVPGTDYELDPVRATFNLGCMIRWLDYNDTWLAAEWGHPSDNLGAILMVADYMSRSQKEPLTMFDVLSALIKAYEIQGVLALENSFNRHGLDHVLLVRVASCALAGRLLGANEEQIVNALSNAWIDGGTLRTYRHAPNTGWRKSWAAGDASARGVQHALMALRGEMGYPSALSAPRWGFYDAVLDGQPLKITRPYESYVMENILFKVAFPVEFHAQTAVECALDLHQKVQGRLDNIDKIVLTTQESAKRIIDKSGPLHNPADRDHCLQYAVAIGLIFGELKSEHYEDSIAQDPRIDRLREKMVVQEEPRYSRDYLDPEKRSIANGVAIHFTDGAMEQRAVEYPIGHRQRRQEALPLLIEKFENNLKGRYGEQTITELKQLLLDQERLVQMPVHGFVDLWI